MLKELASGVAGAVALTAVHETARRAIPHAPRMDVLGARAIARPIRAAGRTPPRWRTLHRAALAGDLLVNGLFYSLIGLGGPRQGVMRRGLLFGIAAGLSAVFLPPVLGLGKSPHRKTPVTQVMTVTWYTLGGLAAAAVLKAWRRATERH
jgi:hypothetical protein